MENSMPVSKHVERLNPHSRSERAASLLRIGTRDVTSVEADSHISGALVHQARCAENYMPLSDFFFINGQVVTMVTPPFAKS